MWASLFGPRSATESTAHDESYVARRSSEPTSAGHISGQSDSDNGQRTRSSLSSSIGPTKRYGMYEFNWPNGTEDDNKEALEMNSNADTTIAPGVKAANFDSWEHQEEAPNSPILKPLSINSTISEPLDPPSLGGIQVTQVSVVEIHERTDGSAVNSVEPTNLPHRGEYNDWKGEADWLPPTSRRNYRHRHSHSDSIMNATISKNISKLLNGFKSTQDQTSKKKTRRTNSRISVRRNEEDQDRPLPTLDETRRLRPKRRTSVMTQGKSKRKSFATNAIQPLSRVSTPPDELYPTSADGRHMLPSPGRRLRRNGATIYRKQTRSLRNAERAPTSNPAFTNDPTDIDDDTVPTYSLRTPWVPKPIRPPQLIHATLVPLPRRLSRNGSRSSTNLSRRTRSSPLNPRRQSKLVPPPSVSVATSAADAQGVIRIPSTRVRRRKRASVISNDTTKRSSVIMRQGLLEDTIMMSIMGGALGTGLQNGLIHNMNHKQEKPLIRKKTKKGSNAVVEDREARRARRQKQKEKKQKEKIEEENNAVTEAEVEMNDEKSRKNEFLMAPPRKIGNYQFSPDFTPDHSPNSSFSSDASDPKPNIEPSPSPSPPPFPAHLARSTQYGNNQLPSKLIHTKPSESQAYARPQRILTDVDRFKEPGTTHELDDVPALTSKSTPTSPTQHTANGRKHKPSLSIRGLFTINNTRTSVPSSASSSVYSPSTQASASPLSPPPPPPLPLPLPPPHSVPTTTQATVSVFPSPITPRPTNPLSHKSIPPIPIVVPPTKFPQSPPLSPIKSLPAAVIGRSRQKNNNESNMNVISPEKLLKMQKFEALLAASEAAGDKKQRAKKKRTDQSSVITSTVSPSEMPLSPILSPMSSVPPTRNPNFGRMAPEMRKKVANIGGIPQSLIPGAVPQLPPLHVGGDSLLRRSLGDSASDRQSMNSVANSITDSVAGSVADSVAESFTIHYRPEEKVELAAAKVGDDGVIRLTLTPAVCR